MTTFDPAASVSVRHGGSGFAPRHKADPYFFASIVLFIWIGLLFGFIPEMIDHAVQNKAAYPWIVHFHGFVFVGWMALVTTQLILVRRGKLATHRRLGHVAFYWGPALVVVGLITVVIVDRARFGTSNWDPQFIAIQLSDLINFSVLLVFALARRTDPAAHKRLMILAVTALGNAGFSRWWGDALDNWLGQGVAPFFVVLYLGDMVIVAAMIVYDLATRARVHRAVLLGGGFLLAVEALSAYLYFNPAWIALSDRLLRP